MFAASTASAQESPAAASPIDLRIALWDVGGLRTRDLLDPKSPRPRAIAEVIQRLRPNILLLSRIAYDTPGGPDVRPGDRPGQNGQRFADAFLAVPQAEGLAPIRYKAFMAAVNSGMASGLDLDRNGKVVTTFPATESPAAAGDAALYAGDAWGYGVYPGQEGMALFVDERLTIQAEQARTFRLFPWDYMPGALIPKAEDQTPGGLTESERTIFRLSSASHWDVPIALPGGATLHILCSQPAQPPASGALKERAERRGQDEIRFWADYAEAQSYFSDDKGVGGGADIDTPFILLSDLGLKPRKGPPVPNARPDPISDILFGARRINSRITPEADLAVPNLAPADTSPAGRTDYVLPSTDLGVISAGIWRHPPEGRPFPSDHYPVWMEVRVIPPPAAPKPGPAHEPSQPESRKNSPG